MNPIESQMAWNQLNLDKYHIVAKIITIETTTKTTAKNGANV